jgi:hypothetical protein
MASGSTYDDVDTIPYHILQHRNKPGFVEPGEREEREERERRERENV